MKTSSRLTEDTTKELYTKTCLNRRDPVMNVESRNATNMHLRRKVCNDFADINHGFN